MAISNRTTTSSKVDIIIVGGGAGGCVIAGRLAKQYPQLQILVIESGSNNRDDPNVITPGYMANHFGRVENTVNVYLGNPSERTSGPKFSAAVCGGMLGGGSSVNYMMYTRGCASDYDDWKNEGWTFEDLKPLFKKMESYGVPGGNEEVHGYDGPIGISGRETEIGRQFIELMKRDYGMEASSDLQDFKTVNKVGFWPKFIDSKTGRRSDTAHAYVHPILDSQRNLHILTESKVVRVLFEGKKATGVEYLSNKLIDPTASMKPRTTQARKLVVLSSGAIGTPLLLERSGIGNKHHLTKLGIPQIISHLPSVGATFRDHHIFVGPIIKINAQEDDTMDDIQRLNTSTLSRLSEQFQAGKGGLTTNYIDVGLKWRPSNSQLHQLGPDFKSIWETQFASKPDKPVLNLAIYSWYQIYHCSISDRRYIDTFNPADIPPEGRYLTAVTLLNYPSSTGSIHATSSTNVDAPADFEVGLLSHAADIGPLVWAYKWWREVLLRLPCFLEEVTSSHPTFAKNSTASAEYVRRHPGEKIHYSDEDENLIKEFISEKVKTGAHSLGTCPMKPREERGVVDRFLNVYGTENLKIADMSICYSVSGNTYSTALVIGEKAAEIIAAELENMSSDSTE